MRLNSQTHPRQTSPCASIPRHTTLVYEVKVIQQDRLGCRDPPMYLTFKMEGATNCKCYNIVVLTLSMALCQEIRLSLKKCVEALGVGYFIMTNFRDFASVLQYPAQPKILHCSIRLCSHSASHGEGVMLTIACPDSLLG